MTTEPRLPTDDFGWLPATLKRLSHDPVKLKPRRTQVSTSSGRFMSGIRWGEVPAEVVYLHGGGQNAHTWDLVAALVAAPALAIDLPGHGHSSWRDDRDYRPETNAETVSEVLAATRTHADLVVGMSLGGLSAIALSGRHPEYVPRLMVVDILPQLDQTSIPVHRAQLGQVALLDGPRHFDTLEMMEQEAMGALGRTRSREALRRGVWHNAVQLSDGTWRWRYDDLRSGPPRDHTGLWDALGRLDAPVTLVRGGASPFVPDASVDRLLEIRPDAEIITVPRAGHAVQSDSPELLAALIGERLARQHP